MHVYNSYTREWIEAKQILSSSLRGERKVGREREREIPVTKNVKLVNKICVRDNKGKRKLRSNLRLSKMID